MGTILIGMWIVYAILGLVLYHKIFTVYYGNLFNGLLGELVSAAFFGFIMSFLTLHFWKIAIIILLIVGLILAAKAQEGSKKAIIIVVFVIISILIGILGNDINNMGNEDNSSSQTTVQTNY